MVCECARLKGLPAKRLALLVFATVAVLRGYAVAETDHQEDIDIVKERFVSALLAREVPAAEVREWMQTLRDDGSWPDIDYKDVSSTGWDHRRHWARLRTLCVAYRRSDSEFHGDPATRSAILSALDFWLEHDFKGRNWYHNFISTPDAITDVLLLMDPALSDAQREKAYAIAAVASLDSRWARPGADRSRIARIAAKLALVRNDPAAFQRAMTVLTRAVHVASAHAVGLQADMSYQHRGDGVTSTLTYGIAYVRDSAEMARKVAGTDFEFTEARRKLLIDFYLDGIAKSMAHGRYGDPQQWNRGISRRRSEKPAGTAVPRMLAAVSSHRRAELEALIAVRQGRKAPAYRFNKYFWRSAYHTHQRSGYFASVRLYSRRNHSMERPYNDEGLRNHYLADGANFMIRSGREYVNMFPVYDWRKIPGTTVVQKQGMPSPGTIYQLGRTDFAGGVSDGLYGATAFDFDSPHDDLKARKAWFFFDNEYVCLGAGIRSGEEHPVATTLNQSLWKGDVAVMDGDGVRTIARGAHALRKPRAVWHDQVAYVFPGAVEAHLHNDQAKGSWWRITRQSWARGAGAVELDRFLLWIDHGTAPEHAEYAYIVAPGLALEDLADYAVEPPVRILSNTPQLQAVAHPGAGVAYGVFYEAGAMSLPDGPPLELAQPGLALFHIENGRVRRIAVADPTGKLGRMRLSIHARLDGDGEAWKAEWNAERKRTDIHVDLPRGTFAGQSVVMDFK